MNQTNRKELHDVRTIGQFMKNGRTRVLIRVIENEDGYRMLDIRETYQAKDATDGKWLPTRRGIAFKPKAAQDFLELLMQNREEILSLLRPTNVEQQ